MAEVRTMRQMKEDYRNYIGMAKLFRDIGEMRCYRDYLRHAEAIEREMKLRRYGSALVL